MICECFTLTGQLDSINLDIYILKCGILVSNVGSLILHYIHNIHVYFCIINSGSFFFELQSTSLHIQFTLLFLAITLSCYLCFLFFLLSLSSCFSSVLLVISCTGIWGNVISALHLNHFISMPIPSHPTNPRKRSSAYAPKFKNPVPLPTIDDFRLSNILSKTLHDQSEAVAQSLLNVTAKFQTDLRTEIRLALTIEQKIQYKNIQVAKLAHAIQKELELRRKRFERVNRGDSNSLRNSSASALSSDVDRVLDLSVKVSASIQSLGVRLAGVDRKNGGSGVPYPQKYPKLARLLEKLDPESVVESHMDEFDVYSASLEEPQIMEYYVSENDVNGLEDFPRHADAREPALLEEITELDVSIPLECSARALVDLDSPKVDRSLGHEVLKSNSSNSLKKESTEIPKEAEVTHAPKEVEVMHVPQEAEVSHVPEAESSSLRDPPLQEDSEELDADAFELLIDTNVEKYRTMKKKQYENLDIFGTEHKKYRSPANPLKLLYSSTIMGNSDMLLKLADDTGGFHSPFAPTKSIPTVSETPLTSHHKKLRINALPMKFSSPLTSSQCDCLSWESPAKKALAATLLKQKLRESNDEDELWSSSGLYTETEENDSDQLLWSSSSDPDSSSASEGDATSHTNNYYLSLKRNLNSKRKRRAKKRAATGFRSESSPSPKHQPSHRILKPKQSILKMKTPERTNANGRANGPTITLSPSADHLLQFKMDTPYRSSPRGSFINDFLAVGFIARSTELEMDNLSEGGDLEDNEHDDNADGDKLFMQTTGDESQTVSKLKRLLI